MDKKSGYQAEYDRLSALFTALPSNKRALVDGLIDQAARSRVTLNACWKDIQTNGRTERRIRTNGEIVETERDVSRIFTQTDRSYQAIMKMLLSHLPDQASGKLEDFMNEYRTTDKEE